MAIDFARPKRSRTVLGKNSPGSARLSTFSCKLFEGALCNHRRS